MLKRLKKTLSELGEAQARLNKIVKIIADSMNSEVCSIYLLRDPETLELCATEGLEIEAVHQTRMRIGEGLVGRVAKTNKAIRTWIFILILNIPRTSLVSDFPNSNAKNRCVAEDMALFKKPSIVTKPATTL